MPNISCPENKGTIFTIFKGEVDKNVSNYANSNKKRLSINDILTTSLNTHKGHTEWAKTNGLILVNIEEDLFELEGAELCLEMSGGHGGNINKTVSINGTVTYNLPNNGTELMQTTFSYPSIPLNINGLVSGINGLQFKCEMAAADWGYYFVDNVEIHCYLKNDHKRLSESGLNGFSAKIGSTGPDAVLGDNVEISLSYPEEYKNYIESVDYFARYYGYDDNGNLQKYDWHGYTHYGEYQGHLGSSSSGPYFLGKWDTHMIPDYNRPMAIKALVHLKGGFKYWTPVCDGLTFPADRNKVELFNVALMSPFFHADPSRNTRAFIDLPEKLSEIEEVQMWSRLWDYSLGAGCDIFTLNGHDYTLNARPKGMHYELSCAVFNVAPEHLVPGENIMRLSCYEGPTHGIEMMPPGPGLVIRFKKK